MKKLLSSILIIMFLLILQLNTNIYATNINLYTVISGRYICDILEGTSVAEFKQNIQANSEDEIFKLDSKQNESQTIETGMTLKTSDNKEYVLVVNGDISCDGKITGTDVLNLKEIIVEIAKERKTNDYAADFNNDKKVTATDLSVMAAYIIGIEPEIPIYCKGIVFDEEKTTIDLSGETKTKMIKAHVTPISSNQSITWYTNDTSIIAQSNGEVTGKANGTATVTALDSNGNIAYHSVEVQTSPIKITLNKTEATIDLKTTTRLQLSATIEPSTANVLNNITYTSSKESVATVGSDGLVTGISSGTAVITARTQNGKEAQANITVVNTTAPTFSPTPYTPPPGTDGTYPPSFITYTNLTEQQIADIADVCYLEQGTREGIAAEASQICNLFEVLKKTDKWSNLYDMVKNSEWWSTASQMGCGKGKNYIDIVKQVIVEGKRTLPGYIDEHDWLPNDIKSVSNYGVEFDKNDRSQYIKHVTKIQSVGWKYTFYCFPGGASSKCDPFGYTSRVLAAQASVGDGCYDINGNPIDGKGGSYRGPKL